jgi:hypothetical protein
MIWAMVSNDYVLGNSRPTSSGSLEERIPKAKSDMVAAAISQNIYLE